MSERINDHRIVTGPSAKEFERSMGEEPIGQEGFDEWARLVEKELPNGRVTWHLLCSNACEAMSPNPSVPRDGGT